MSRTRRHRKDMKRWRYSQACLDLHALSGYRKIYLHPKTTRELDQMLMAPRTPWEPFERYAGPPLPPPKEIILHGWPG